MIVFGTFVYYACITGLCSISVKAVISSSDASELAWSLIDLSATQSPLFYIPCRLARLGEEPGPPVVRLFLFAPDQPGRTRSVARAATSVGSSLWPCECWEIESGR